MPIVEPAIRPPSEASSFLLQVTLGCSANHCAFCGAYAGKPFGLKDPEEIRKDIDRFARQYPETRRVFLMDGDALVLNNQKLLPILRMLGEAFPKLTRVSSYANGKNIAARSDEELGVLRGHKLSLIYMGLESGCQSILDDCGKSSGVEDMVTAVKRAAAAGIKSSIIVLLGLGGRARSAEHVRSTIEALNRMQPRYLSFLSLMLIPGTPLAQKARNGRFEELGSDELLGEAHDILRGLELTGTIFRSDHASNYLSLEGALPKDKTKLLAHLQSAIQGEVGLRPDFFRGL